MSIGMLIMTSASIDYSLYKFNHSFYFGSRQLIFAFVGLVAAGIILLSPMSKWYEWFTENEKDISLRDMSIYLVCLKKLGRDVNLSQLEILMEETPERKYGYELNYRLYQLYDDRSYLKSSYEKIMDIKSKLDDKTGEKFINYPLESEIVKVYQSIS